MKMLSSAENLLVVLLLFTASLSEQQKVSPEQVLYSVQSTLGLRQADGGQSAAIQPLTTQLTGKVVVNNVYHQHPHTLLHIQVNSLQHSVQDRENDNQFIFTSSPVLASTKNQPFLVHLNDRRIEQIYLDPNEETSIKNFKKAIASLFQFQTENLDANEMDICGLCEVTYEMVNDYSFLKHKINCTSHLSVDDHQQALFGATNRTIDRRVEYQLDNTKDKLVKAASRDLIDMRLSFKQEIGISLISSLNLVLEETQQSKIPLITGKSVDEAISQIGNLFKFNLKPDALYTAEERKREDNSLHKVFQQNRKFLSEKYLGQYDSAYAFVAILRSVLLSSEAEIVKILKNKKTKPILNQFMDILGCAQSFNAHKAVLKTFDLISMKNPEPVERYLWALSVGLVPKLEFVEDLIAIFKKKPTNENLKETIILTIAALAKKFSIQTKEDVYAIILKSLQSCPKTDNRCQSMYLRAIKNLQYVKAKSILVKFATKGSRMVSVTALKVLYSFPSSSWDEEVMKAVESIYYQRRKIYDSSARTIAADIIIDSQPTEATLENLLCTLQSNTSYEVRKYVLQRLQQTALNNETFNGTLRKLMNQKNLFHYDFLGQRGLSNSLTRSVFTNKDLNASIFTVNEISKSVLKRGHFSLALEQRDQSLKAFSLDMFTNGLSSFLWSDEVPGEEEPEEAEELIAGVELSMYEVQLRPFVFFHGHASLMGHILAGTASERTPIFQAMRSVLNYKDTVAVSSGHVVKMVITGGTSFELAGRISFSIWNRNANSFIDAKVGVAVDGSISADTFYAENNLNLKILSENEIGVKSDLDFYNEMLFCLQISQMKTTAKYEFEQRQTVFQTENQISRRNSQRLDIPGRTFNLNQKNNEMCAEILGRAS